MYQSIAVWLTDGLAIGDFDAFRPLRLPPRLFVERQGVLSVNFARKGDLPVIANDSPWRPERLACRAPHLYA